MRASEAGEAVPTRHGTVGSSGRTRAGSRSRLLALLASQFALVSGGCSFFYVPPERAKESLHRHVNWIHAAEVGSFTSYAAVREAVGSDLGFVDHEAKAVIKHGRQDEDDGPNVLLEFLHISDAQVRDETVYNAEVRAELGFIDWLISVSKRGPHVEALDSLVLASFLANYQARCNSTFAPLTPRFVVHTGDALDISLVSELVEVLNVFRAARAGGVDVYSVAGNHDGLFYGNISDGITIDYDLGANLNEFVLGHVAAGDQGFGFARNELIEALRRSPPLDETKREAIEDAVGEDAQESVVACDQALDRIDELTPTFGADIHSDPLRSPAALKALIVAGPDSKAIQLGYYDWSARLPPESVGTLGKLEGFRFITLDTRAGSGAMGALSQAQLGWVYLRLVEALENHEAVILFAHHEPDDFSPLLCAFEGQAESDLEDLLDRFPNVLGYFFGHGHTNTERGDLADDDELLMVQTGSIADFPQVGRLVRVSADPHAEGATLTTLQVELDFVRPQGATSPAGAHLQGKLHASFQDSWLKQSITEKSNVGWRYVFRVFYWLGALCNQRSAESEWEGLEPCAIDRVVHFEAEAPSPEDVFGCWDAPRIREVRQALGLDPLPE